VPTTVIPNGVDSAHLARSQPVTAVRESLGFRPGDFVLGYVGRFSDEKRPHLVAQAVARLPPNFKALFVGWGPLQAPLMDYSNRLIPGRYAFVRAVNDVGDYYGAMDALCLPSEEEGFGLVILEAMFCERPVIATPVGCVPELVRDRVNGLVVQGTAEEIANVARLLHRHPAWARGVAREGRSTAEASGHARVMARAYENLFLELWRAKFGRQPESVTVP
jgi:glycosyltransferase involved in cell wall biosynthesis